MTFLSSDPTLSLRWPQFFLAADANHFLWGEGRQVLTIEAPSAGPVLVARGEPDLTRSLGKLLAAARSTEGTVAVLDVSGRIGARTSSGNRWQFETHLPNPPAALAVAKNRVYLLLQGESPTGSAVAAYTLEGKEVGQWGEMPPDGAIQANLRGGGIAACPDGSVYYSYINSPRIRQLKDDKERSTLELEADDDSFEVISKSKIHRAVEDSMRSGSPGPIVKLGLSASRVMTLVCSNEGLLFRQIARPGGKGSYVEVWQPATSVLMGKIPHVDGVLMDVQNQTLFLGLSEGEKFVLDRVDVRLSPPHTKGGTV